MNRDAEKKNNTNEYIIPPLGSLGLLAFGDIGLRQWRKVRDQAYKDGKLKKIQSKK